MILVFGCSGIAWFIALWYSRYHGISEATTTTTKRRTIIIREELKQHDEDISHELGQLRSTLLEEDPITI